MSSATPRQKAVCRAIVSTFETSPPTCKPKYSEFAVLRDGAGISYGAHQGTDRSDALDKIVALYIEREGLLADELRPYDFSDDSKAGLARRASDPHLKDVLERAGFDPVMQAAQEEVFEVNYMRPAIAAWAGSSFVETLSLAVLYDSMIHGSFAAIRDLVPSANERLWIPKYLGRRRREFSIAGSPGARFKNPILRNTLYRQDTFLALIARGNWSLETPFLSHGVTVHEDDLILLPEVA